MRGQMNDMPDTMLPPVRLAIRYAPAPLRPLFAVLLELDARFADVVGTAREPLIAQMKLAWWRDAVQAPPDQRPKGEPLLARAYALDNPVLYDAMVALANAWEQLIGADDWPAPLIHDFAQQRGQAVFATYAKLGGLPGDYTSIAAQWAVDDLRMRFGDRVPGAPAKNAPLPQNRARRPLTILALSVRSVSGPRLIIHALTGR
jgi:15-cis-phytoene synthase